MKKVLLYILLFSLGIVLGLIFFNENSYTNKNKLLAVDKPAKQEQHNFMYRISSMLGRDIVINGNIKEAYKNKNNEMVLYVKVDNIPVLLNCTLKNTNKQIKTPIKIDEAISLKGSFWRLNEQMELKNCLLLRREK